MDPIFKIKLLGNFDLILPNGESAPVSNQRAKALVALLALSENYTLERAKVYDILWSNPDHILDIDHLQTRFRSCKTAFGKQLGSDNLEALLNSEKRKLLQLRPNAIEIDVEILRSRLINWQLGHTLDFIIGKDPHIFLEQLEINKEQSLSDWIEEQRAEWHQFLASRIKEILKQCLTIETSTSTIFGLSDILLKIDPADEETYRDLMLYHARSGNIAAAKRHFEACKDYLEKDIQVPPSETTLNLMKQISEGDHLPSPLATGLLPENEANDPISLAVLPFQCFSLPEFDGNINEIQFGLCEEIIASLSRISEFHVISHSSVMGFQTPQQAAKTIGRLLKVRFLVTGTIRSNGKALRIRVNLVDCQDDKTLWNQQYDDLVENIFDLETRISQAVAGELEPNLIQHVIRRVIRSKPQNLGAYELTMRAVPSILRLTRSEFQDAKELLKKALEIDPNCAPSHTWLAFWYAFNNGQGWSKAPVKDMEQASKHALLAIDLDPDDARAHAIAGHVENFLHGRIEAGTSMLDRAIELNKNSGFAWAFSAIGQCYQGKPEVGLERMKKYADLCPLDPQAKFFDTIYCIAYTLLEDYERAADWGRRTVDYNPNFANGYKPLIASLGHLGLTSEARKYITRLLALEQDFSIEKFRSVYHLKNKHMIDRYCEGLRLAGIPEQSPIHRKYGS